LPRKTGHSRSSVYASFELNGIVAVLQDYEVERWPCGKKPIAPARMDAWRKVHLALIEELSLHNRRTARC
jgi:hypothetical protein